MSAHRGIFHGGQLHRQVRRETRRNRMFVWLWMVVPDRRQLIHKGRKP